MDRVKFTVNGVEHSVGCEVSSDVTLLDYLRNSLELRGTKYMCREGGCGACIVSAVVCPGGATVSVNSCMVSITSCQGWCITTIEEIGNRKTGYQAIQKKLAAYNGTQCGYCSPGWVMALYSLLRSRNDLTMLEIERSFGSNICRCTGYRSILEAFKTCGKDAPKSDKVLDIEDLHICKKTVERCSESDCDESDWCFVLKNNADENIIEIQLKDDRCWFRVYKVHDIFQIFERIGNDSYMLVNGNTAKGAYPILEYPQVLIDISGVAELKGYSFDQNLIIGAGTTLTELLDICQKVSKRAYFTYLQKFYDHLQIVAHIPIRNLGTIGGNLMIKHQHNEFSSDIYLLLETVGAQLNIQKNISGLKQIVTMQQFLALDMRGCVILNAMLPPLGTDYQCVTFKVMPRSQNAHAIVNAGFLYKLNTYAKVELSRIVYGGLSAKFTRAVVTEKYLIGKQIFTNNTLQSALAVLESELIVTENPPEPSSLYRNQLALGLFYKGLLVICPESDLNERYRCGASKIHETRPLSKAQQTFDTNPSLWPLNQPIPKVEALIQCAGEAFYTEDLPTLPYEVFAAFALTTVPKGDIVSIDPCRALEYPGVIAFYTAEDIPGLNSFTPAESNFYKKNEEVLCSGKVKYFNQPFGIIVAISRYIANVASKMIDVKYENVTKPVIDVKEARKDPNRIKLFSSIDATDRGNNIAKVIQGVNAIYGQYHFTIETLTSVIHPTEEGLSVYSATHWIDGVQLMISRALNIDQNRVDVNVRRVGGSYGLKLSRNIQVDVACSLVVYKLNRPCRFIQSLTTNTRAVGKRLPCCAEFEVGVSNTGLIQHMNYNLYEDDGYEVNEQFIEFGAGSFYNCYDRSRWNYKNYDTITDTAKNTWFRAPGTLENIAMTELIMEQIAYELSLDPLEVRLANLDYQHFGVIKEMIDNVKVNGDYNKRRAAVDKFNADNRWKKRGLRFSLMRWTPGTIGPYGVTLAVFHGDGTVAITHGGVEIGQGLNTKAIQICAFLLNIPIEKVIVKGSNTTASPNCFQTAASQTSQNIGVGVKKCCEELLKRLKPIRNQLNNPTWEEVIVKAFELSVDLQTHYYVTEKDNVISNVYGVTLAEVEIDVLTGELEVLRVDLMEDVGQSVSPEIDIGQAEGAFVMGLGYWTSEKLVYDRNTGELLTDRTWDYYVPQARDIPQDFRVYFKKNSYSTDAVFGSKCIGEPPLCMSVSIVFAIREAITSARLESGIPTTEWFPSIGPYTVEKICLESCTKTKDYKFS